MTYTAFPIPTSNSNAITPEEAVAAIEAAHEGKAYIMLESRTTQAISADSVNPTILDNWVVLKAKDVSLQGDSIRNDTTRTIASMVGTVGINPQVDGGGNRLLRLNSERSQDGITYTINNQNRPIATNSSSETYNTKESYLTDFLSGEYVRFIAYADGAMSVTESTASFRGVVTTGPALLWILVES